MTFTRELVLLAATALAWFAYALMVGNPDPVDPLISDVVRTAALVLSGVLGVRAGGLVFIDGLMERVWGLPSNALIRLVVYMALTLIATGFVLKVGLDLNVTTLLTTSALLTAILGFAMQSTLAAFFSGVALQLERHIRPGDGIVVDGALAVVETVGWRSMTARRSDGALVMVPNTIVATGAVPIRRPGELARTGLTVAAPLAAPPAMVIDVLCEAVMQIPGIAPDHAVSASLSGTNPAEDLADFSVSFYSWPASPDETPMASLARLRIWYAFQRYGLLVHRFKFAMDADALLPFASTGYPEDAPLDNVVRAVTATGRWRQAGATEVRRLIGGGRRLLFAPGEPILLPRELDGATAVVVAGEVRAPGDGGAEGIQPGPGHASDPGLGARWDMELILRVEAQLAAAIGPYARRATRRAAQDSDDLATLYRRLAVFIGDERARDAFLKLGPQRPFRDFGPGTSFVVSCTARGPASAPVRLAAVGHVEILAVPAHMAQERAQAPALAVS